MRNTDGLLTAPPAGANVIDASSAALAPASTVTLRPISAAGIQIVRGYHDAAPALSAPDRNGVHHVPIAPLSRVAIDLNPSHDRLTVEGYERIGDVLHALPTGAQLDAQTGTFTWAPGLAFGGTRHLVFVRGGELVLIDVAIDARMKQP